MSKSFFHDPVLRAARCADEKDPIVQRVISGLEISDPANYKALLMPGNNGPEVNHLFSRGVSQENMWAVERDPKAFRDLRNWLPKANLTSSPSKLSDAMDFIEANWSPVFDFVYFDFYGQPGKSLRLALTKLIKLKMVQDVSTRVLREECPLL